jgi:hypothetical protein
MTKHRSTISNLTRREGPNTYFQSIVKFPTGISRLGKTVFLLEVLISLPLEEEQPGPLMLPSPQAETHRNLTQDQLMTFQGQAFHPTFVVVVEDVSADKFKTCIFREAFISPTIISPNPYFPARLVDASREQTYLRIQERQTRSRTAPGLWMERCCRWGRIAGFRGRGLED